MDLGQIHGYGLGPEVDDLLVGLALFKIRALLDGDLRLRTACDLKVKGAVRVEQPKDWPLPHAGRAARGDARADRGVRRQVRRRARGHPRRVQGLTVLRVQVRFLAGRYHATPSGRHVNEGAVEWPPSPWRIARALLATGFSKLGWKQVPAQATSALDSLCARVPVLHLPPAGAGHTRHYMPLFKDTTTKVIDAFVHPGDQPMVIEWGGEVERKAGWSQPPGSRVVAYRRPGTAFDVSPPRRRRAVSPNANTALLALVPDTVRAPHLPRMRDAVARAEMLHKSLVRFSDTRRDGGASPCFTGKGTMTSRCAVTGTPR